MSSEEKIVILDVTNASLVLNDHIGLQESQQPFREVGKQLVHVNHDTLLNYGVLDLGTAATSAIFRIQNHVEKAFTQFLWNKKFTQIQTPKLIARSSEGGASCLAQSPQLYKQMVICGDFRRVFEIGSVFGAEDSFTQRHLCEFTGLDVEMEKKNHYSEVMDIVDRLSVAIFDSLNQNCKKDLEVVGNQDQFEPLKYLQNTPRLTYEEGRHMLKVSINFLN